MDLAHLLVEYGVNATVPEKDWLTPLHVAVWRGSVDQYMRDSLSFKSFKT